MGKKKQRRKKIQEDFNIAYKKISSAIAQINNTQKDLSIIKVKFLDIQEKMERLQSIINDNSISDELIIDTLGDYTKNISKVAYDFYEQMDFIRQETPMLSSCTVTASTIATSSVFAVMANEELSSIPQLARFSSNWKTPTLNEEREEVNKLLKVEIGDYELIKKFNTIWQTYFDESKDFGVNLPAYELREFISTFLQKLAPDQKVELMPWCHKEKGKILQTIRAIYVILGNRTAIDLKINRKGANSSDYFIRSIVSAAKRIRNIYREASRLAHWREDTKILKEKGDIKQFEKEVKKLKIKTKKLLMDFLQSTKEIIQLRKINFTN